MKNYLPKDPRGFTLVELIVVIAIIAVLSVVGLAVYQGQTKNARDSRRRVDVDQIAKAMEAARDAGAAEYPAMEADFFAGSLIPVDPTNTVSGTTATCPGACQYCYTLSSTPITNCPASGGSYINSTTTVPSGWGGTNTSATWTVCANLESGGAFCRSNAQ